LSALCKSSSAPPRPGDAGISPVRRGFSPISRQHER
jgi:hypothetical protein